MKPGRTENVKASIFLKHLDSSSFHWWRIFPHFISTALQFLVVNVVVVVVVVVVV